MLGHHCLIVFSLYNDIQLESHTVSSECLELSLIKIRYAIPHQTLTPCCGLILLLMTLQCKSVVIKKHRNIAQHIRIWSDVQYYGEIPTSHHRQLQLQLFLLYTHTRSSKWHKTEKASTHIQTHALHACNYSECTIHTHVVFNSTGEIHPMCLLYLTSHHNIALFHRTSSCYWLWIIWSLWWVFPKVQWAFAYLVADGGWWLSINAAY